MRFAAQKRNSKSKARNPKQIQNTHEKNTKRFEFWLLEFRKLFRISIFDIRIFTSYQLFLSILLALIFTVVSVTTSYAQSINPYNVPSTDSNVPANQHTRVQSVIIDLLSSTVCILIGVDPSNPKGQCLDINPQTGKIGYNQASLDKNGLPKVGGIIGASTHLIAMTYTSTIRTSQYTDYIAQNFGIVKPAYAQATTQGYGFNGLNAMLSLWTSIRNIAYFLLMVAFVIIGLGIMLRVKVDPRTVMTLQNQIPRIIVCIILVTFSYGIAGLLIDSMWLTTYIGINVITSAGGTNPMIPGDGNRDPGDPNREDASLSKRATQNLLSSPLTYVNQVFRALDDPNCKATCNVDSGIGHIVDEISYSLGHIVEEIVRQFLPVCSDSAFGWSTLGVIGGALLAPVTGGISLALGAPMLFCVLNVLIGFIATVLLWIIILIIILKTLFSVWMQLIKAYTYTVLYTIGAPFFIVMGLLPGKPLGFEKWLRSMVANLAVFPMTAFMFVIARLFMDLFNTTNPTVPTVATPFIPPLIGQPNIIGLMGAMLAFGVLLMTPTVLTQLQEALKVPGNKHGGAAIGGAIAAGASVPKAGTGFVWDRAMRKAKYGEHDSGWIRQRIAGKGLTYDRTEGKLGWNPNTWRKGLRNVVDRKRMSFDKHDIQGHGNYDDQGKRIKKT